MRRYSLKRQKDNRVYSKRRKLFLDEAPCAANLEGCTGEATQVHHKAGRTGDNFLNVATWLPVCDNCHIKIELSPVMAKERGFSLSRIS